jgi:hypothetical protein
MMKLVITPRDPKSIDEMKRMLKEEWDAISQESIDDFIKSAAKRMRIYIENDDKFIGHLLNPTQAMFLARQAAQIQLPPGVTIPRKIGVPDVGQIFSICGIVIKNCILRKDPTTLQEIVVVVLQDAEQSAPRDEMPRSIEVLVGQISEEEKVVWESGAFLRFELFTTAAYDPHLRFREIRTQGSLRIRLEFRKFPKPQVAQ